MTGIIYLQEIITIIITPASKNMEEQHQFKNRRKKQVWKEKCQGNKSKSLKGDKSTT